MNKPSNAGTLARNGQTMPAAPASFAQYVKAPAVLTSIEKTLGSSAKRETFVAALLSAVSTNSALQECEFNSIISAALLGESLKLPPSPQLGYFYMVPYNSKAKKAADGSWTPSKKVAQFQMGYKGYIQLAQRSGFFRRINVTSVKEGELISWDPFNEELDYRIIPNRNEAKTIGYYAFFELTNGFRKAIYMPFDEMLDHADRYSKAFSKDAYLRLQAGQIRESEAWKYSSFWYKNFDMMAYKTMLRQLISKWAPMSVDLQKGIENDQQEPETLEPSADEIIEFVQPASEIDELPFNDVETTKTEELAKAD